MSCRSVRWSRGGESRMVYSFTYAHIQTSSTHVNFLEVVFIWGFDVRAGQTGSCITSYRLQVWLFEAGSQWKGQWFSKDCFWMTSVGWQVCACLERRNYTAVSLGPGSMWQLTFLKRSNQVPLVSCLSSLPMAAFGFTLAGQELCSKTLKTLGENAAGERERRALLGLWLLNFA